MNKYTPDCWVKIRITSDEYGSIDKILAGWYGGYLNGDSWKINSGITKTEEFDDRYEFTGYTGSVYVCYKNAERMSGMTSSIYDSLVKQLETVPGAKIEILKCTLSDEILNINMGNAHITLKE